MTQVMHHKSNHLEGIMVTDAAKEHFIKCLNKQENSKGVRIWVKKTGCSGLSYVVDYVLEPQDSDLLFIFGENYPLYVEKSSYPYLKGMTVDYVKQGLNQKLVFSNPNQVGQCGCGESFTVE